MIKTELPDTFRREERTRLASLATSNVELFRYEALKAFEAFTPEQRRWAEELEASSITALDFYKIYEQQFKPLIEELDKAATRPVFIRTLRTSLRLDEADASELAVCLLNDRKAQVVATTTSPFDGRTQLRAAQILALPIAKIDHYKDIFENYLIYKHVAETSKVAVIDTHAGFVRRLGQRYLVWRQCRALAASKMKRLNKLQSKLRKFEQVEGDLPGLIVERGLDLMLILSARHTYEKRRKETAKNSLDETRLFDASTKKLVDDYMTKYMHQHPKSTIRDMSREEAALKELLLRVFELDTTARNHLVVIISECRTLYEEIRRIV